MTILALIIGWISRHALVFVLLVAALAIYGQYNSGARSARSLEGSVTRLEAAQADLRADLDRLQTTAVTTLGAAERASLTAIDARIAGAIAARNQLQTATKPTDFLTAPKDAITASVRRDFEIELLTQEIAFLTQVRANVANRGAALSLDARIETLGSRIAADTANIAALPSTLSPERYIRDDMAVLDLADVYAERRAGNIRARETLITARRRLGDIAPLATPNVAVAALEAHLTPLAATAQSQAKALEETTAYAASRAYARYGIADLLRPAALLLLAIILTPFVIRAVFYWVLAPLAALQKPIKLLATTATIALPTDRSAVSHAIAPGPGHELLVRQGFVQTVSQSGAKATQLLLDPRHPLSSVVSGLWFLTRIRGGPGDTTTVSAVHDPFAEIAVLSLPAGAAAVLQPRAIAGVVQPIASPLRITSHWRLGTLSAWLTWQLRFLVFHGPAEIILTGGRGVRIEPALAGRSVGQDQLIGFSAGLAYSTGRTETFLPYFLGRESLLKDRVAAGTGVLIAEEAPNAGRARSGIKRGLEGATDALLKVFGI